MGKGKRLFCMCCLLILLNVGSTTTLPMSAKPIEHRPVPVVIKTASPTVVASTPVVGMENPTRLQISGVGLDAAIENIGVLPNGDLATPTQNPWEDVGWYHLGARPGETGSAVIAGHLDRPGGAPAVFWNLRNVHIGDTVTVVDARKVSLHFRVTQVAAYPPQEAPLEEIFANPGGKYLNLITCAGDWIPSQRQTTLRLVVYTTLMQ